MTNYSGFHALYMSFFSKDLYRSVVRNWKGIAFLYLFLIVTASWAIISLRIFIGMSGLVNGPIKDLIDKLPAVTIHAGELKLDKPSPYIVTLPVSSASQLSSKVDSSTPANKETPIAVFDDTTDDVKGYDNVAFIVTKHYLYIQSSQTGESKAQEYALKDFGEMQYTKKSYQELANMLVTWVPVVIFLFCAPIFFACTAILVLIFGAIGMAAGGTQNIKLTYAECLRIASVAFTPSVFFDTIAKSIPLPQMPILVIIPPLLALAYTIFGVIANKQLIVVETSMPGGMPHTTPPLDDDFPPTDPSTPMT